MSEMKRLVESSSSPAARLLRVGLRDAPDPGAAKRAALGLGLGSAAATAASTSAALGASAAAKGSISLLAPAATTTAGASAIGTSASVLAVVGKWVVIGALGGGLAAQGAATISQAPRERSLAHRIEPARQSFEAFERGSGQPRAVAPIVAEASTAPSAPDIQPAIAEKQAVSSRQDPEHASRRTVVAPRADAKPAEASGALGHDLGYIEGTRSALATGESRKALSILNAYDRQRVTGFFDREALILRIEALLQQGDRPAALTLASDYFRRFPGDAHTPRLQALLQETGARQDFSAR
jgi:hypothetical protein